MLSSINTGLAQVPDLTDIVSVGRLSYHLISLYNAVAVLQQAIDSYTGNTPQGSSASSQTPEQTVLVGNTANMWCTAGVAINAGYLVNLYNNSGATAAQFALGGPVATAKPAMGISMSSATVGNSIQILLFGLFNFSGSVTPGQLYYLSTTVNGGLTTTPPSAGSGSLIQPVGFGVDTNSIWFNPDLRLIAA